MSNAFNWIEFPEGYARFCGGVRGWDERGHETFALVLRGREYFGEIKRSYLDNHNDFNIVFDSLGYRMEIDVGMPGRGARPVFTSEEEAIARALAVRLVQFGLVLAVPPYQLSQLENSRFMGKIFFREGWMLVDTGDGGTA